MSPLFAHTRHSELVLGQDRIRPSRFSDSGASGKFHWRVSSHTLLAKFEDLSLSQDPFCGVEIQP